FFQAEDGIRDKLVTGVQTCALPISPGVRQQVARHDPGGAAGGGPLMAALRLLMIDNYDSFTYNLVQYLGELGAEVDVRRNDAVKIGRASCRERVWIEVVGV